MRELSAVEKRVMSFRDPKLVDEDEVNAGGYGGGRIYHAIFFFFFRFSFRGDGEMSEGI